MKSKEELRKNPFISYALTCKTEAMKVKDAYLTPIVEWAPLDTAGIINKFKNLKERDQETAVLSENKVERRRKHIVIHDSSMIYYGNFFDKTSRIISCKLPF